MNSDGFKVTGWCQNIFHPDHLHRLEAECQFPITLEERLSQLKQAIVETGSMEALSENIDALREAACDRVFWGIISFNRLKEK